MNIQVIKHKQERFLSKNKVITKDDQSILVNLTLIRNREFNMKKIQENREGL